MALFGGDELSRREKRELLSHRAKVTKLLQQAVTLQEAVENRILAFIQVPPESKRLRDAPLLDAIRPMETTIRQLQEQDILNPEQLQVSLNHLRRILSNRDQTQQGDRLALREFAHESTRLLISIESLYNRLDIDRRIL